MQGTNSPFSSQIPSLNPPQRRVQPQIIITPQIHGEFPMEHTNNPNFPQEQESSLELCAIRLENYRHTQNSFYSGWEIDADDPEDRKILEDLLGPDQRLRFVGTASEEDHVNPLIDTRSPVMVYPEKNSLIERLEAQIQELSASDSNVVPAPKTYFYDNFEKYMMTRAKQESKEELNQNKLKVPNYDRPPKNGLDWILHGPMAKSNTVKKDVVHVMPSKDMKKNAADENALKVQQIKATRTVVKFNVMAVGEAGVGKSSFIDCFLEAKYDRLERQPNSREKEGVLVQDDVALHLSFLDTQGYRSESDLKVWYKNLKIHIKKRFEEFKLEKVKSHTQKKRFLEDKRIHLVLYFFSGPRIKPADFIYIKKLAKYCNVVPVLAKGDMYTKEETQSIKSTFIQMTQNPNIKWFDFQKIFRDDPERLKLFTQEGISPRPPFVVVSANKKIEVEPNKFVLGRQYSWGVCNIEDPKYSDFSLLQELIGGLICFEAILRTNQKFYKQYFQKKKAKKMKETEKIGLIKSVGYGTILTMGLAGVVYACMKKATAWIK